ncbi:Ca-activated chloride channel family protein [Devosia sp. UYZn731]|uniref:vWA domain-containing protein n=1 Tax=Devosia sp. UYZn731 TaxID=3156345 RepID=UPI0033919E0D
MSDDMNDGFKSLKDIQAPAASDAAKKRALAASMMAFEAAKTETAKNNATAPQGVRRPSRLSSIITSLKGKSIMDMRLPIGTAAIALLLLPLGYQLYNSTSMSPADRVPVDTTAQGVVPPKVTPPPTTMPVNPNLDLRPPLAAETDPAAPTPATKDESEPSKGADPVVAAPVVPQVEPAKPAQSPTVQPQPEPLAQDSAAAPAAADMLANESAMAPPPPAPIESAATSRLQTRAAPSAGIIAPEGDFYAVPAPMSSATEPSGDEFTQFDESRLKVVASEPVSTFSIDVDTASYSYVRSVLDDGYVPEPDAVRLEELINYFPYDYAPADSAAVPFKPTMAVFPTPWNPKTQLLHIGIKGYVPPAGEDKPSNLVFLIDTSGSMDEPNKLPLLKRAFALLVDQLSAKDTVSIVAYAGSAGVVLEPTKADDKAKILAALDNLAAGGSTAGAEGIELAYKLAEQAKVADGTNRVILATDGDFNVGIDNPDDLETFIKSKRDKGVTLSVLGFGRGNLDDATMQALAQNGNGNAAYIDNFREAQKVLVEEGGSTLDMIAKDVKIQVEFNPAMVSEYRLIGYETRALNREDFNNDAVDAGDIGAGHTVTAIYEITPAGSDANLVDPLRYDTKPAADPAAVATTNAPTELAFLKMRYKLPNEDVSQLLEVPVTPSVVYGNIDAVSPDMKFAAAVAAFGQKLKGSNYGGAMSWSDIAMLAQTGRGADTSGYRAEFMGLIKTASLLKPDTATQAKPNTPAAP